MARNKEPTKKHNIYLRDGDWDYLASVYSASDRPVSSVIRQIVSTYVDRLKVAEAQIEGDQDDDDNIEVKL